MHGQSEVHGQSAACITISCQSAELTVSDEQQEDYGNPYEQTFNERHRKKPRGNNYNDRGDREDRLKLGQYSRYAAPQSEDALHPKR